MNRPSLAALLVLLVFPLACRAPEPPDPGEDPTRLGSDQIAAEVAAAMDTAADPCGDFYRYACGGWVDATEIPGDQPRWIRSFSEITEQNRAVLREILDDAAANPGDDADRARLGTFWQSCMDEGAVEAAGVEPLTPWLEAIAEVDGAQGLMTVAGLLQAQNVNVLLGLGVVPDFKNPEMNIGYFSQGGLGLPDRDYYLGTDERRVALRGAYGDHVAAMLAALGRPEEEAARQAAAVVAFETGLAQVSRRRQDLRDPEATYNKLDIDGLKALTPRLDWGAFLEAAGYPDIIHINVAVPEFFEGLETLAHETDPAALRAYLTWHLLHATADYLPAGIVETEFAFYGRTLSGQKEIQPRWKRCLQSADGALGDILGRLYVERRFAGESKEIALELIRGIETAFEANLTGLGWMDATTAGRAAEKMHAVRNKIGYPDTWRDYTDLSMETGDLFGNAMRAGNHAFRYELDKVGEPVDDDEWHMTPPTVNAYYNPMQNEMVFPAGVLQPSFFHRDYPEAMNYGGIGMVMGHELTHGFDDRGRRFDAEGRLTQWWESEAEEKFREQAQCVVDLYDGYEVQDGLPLNGTLTLGENIADLGGLKQAWVAYRNAVGDEGAGPSIVDGLTNDQLFFVNFAQGWCSLISPEWERRAVIEDSHSHPRFRVRGPVSQLREFAETFQCAAGSPMNPEQICEVW